MGLLFTFHPPHPAASFGRFLQLHARAHGRACACVVTLNLRPTPVDEVLTTVSTTVMLRTMAQANPPAGTPGTRQRAQKDLVEQARRTAGVAEALQIHDALGAYLKPAPANVTWLHYATGGNQT
jgi:hypothetical protein